MGEDFLTTDEHGGTRISRGREEACEVLERGSPPRLFHGGAEMEIRRRGCRHTSTAKAAADCRTPRRWRDSFRFASYPCSSVCIRGWLFCAGRFASCRRLFG